MLQQFFFLYHTERKGIPMKISYTKGIKLLIIVLLLLATLFNKELAQQLMLAAILIWIAATSYLLLHPRITALAALIKARRTRTETENTAPAPDVSNWNSQKQKQILQHISLRVTEKLKSAYSDATWIWNETPNLTDILNGAMFRVTVSEMESYTHADILFDRFGRIRITPLIIGEFASTGNANAQPKAEETGEPAVIDVQSWYALIGKRTLEAIITDLNANGHSRLSIKENGDIVITRNKKETLRGTLDQFPPKNYWNEILKLLEEYELHGKAEKDHIIVSWT